ncbi:hypothetical protein F3Y22_tig00116965pilonHSYRG00691 [Hibiscus syriacus]|uniref:Uncharacterized protein n=1 Tax=Hibiscus syriacus TaxID=106335 RepID=A0A6A2XXE2_HIBSY|nr:hypothetical protein F3Y22_tig00116965pilonHSYRG00691 [Hibiscus syriacus]
MVAHQRRSGEFIRFPPVEDGGSDHHHQQQQQEDGFRQENRDDEADMIFGPHSHQATEMSEMVSALTHVVSGQRAPAGAWGYHSDLDDACFGHTQSGSAAGSGSGPWNIGRKRGREEEIMAQLVEPEPGAQTESHAGSSSAATSATAETTCDMATVSNEETGERRRRYRGDFPATETPIPTSLTTHFPSYYQSPNPLHSSADFKGQPATSLLNQMIQSSQLPNIQPPVLSSSLSPPLPLLPSSSSSASFPLFSAEQMGIFRPPSSKTQASESDFPPPPPP